MGFAAVPPPKPNSGGDGDGGRNASSIANVGGTVRPRTGSIDLALGVGVGLCLGGAAMFVILMTRFRRTSRWPQQGQGQGQGAGGFGYDGVRLHGGGSGAAGGGGVSRWPRGRKGFPVRGGKAKAGPKEVSVELGRVGFDYDGTEAQDFAELKLQEESDVSQVHDQDDAREMSRADDGSLSVLADAPRRAAWGFHRRPDGAAVGAGLGLGLAPMRSSGGRVEGSPSPLRREVVMDERLQDSSSESEHDALLGRD